MERTTVTPPPHPSQERPQPKETPYSRGSGSHINYASEHTVSNYNTYLHEDTKIFALLPFRDFLRVALNHPEEQWDKTRYEAIVGGERFKESRAAYGAKLGKPAIEQERYPHLRDLLGCIKDGLETDALTFEVDFGQNDPKSILGSAALRKPDFGIFDLNAFERGPRCNQPDKKNTPPDNARYHWSELFGFLEVTLAKHPSKLAVLDEIQLVKGSQVFTKTAPSCKIYTFTTLSTGSFTVQIL